MIAKPATKEAVELFHQGTLAFSQMECNGFRIDTKYLDSELRRTGKRIKKGENALKSSKVWNLWKRKFRSKSNLGSEDQLAEIFFGEMKFQNPCGRTPSGKWKTDEEAFADIDHPFVKNYFKLKKLKKMHGTYLLNIKRETTNEGFLHIFFNLHTARSYRSSASDLNLQNIPIRNPLQGPTIRKCFIPRDGHVLIEIDYSGLEFTIAGCITQDPAIKRYIVNKGDPHRDLAAKIFMVKPEDVTKDMRFSGKNQWVFPQLYGSYYKSCAPVLWQAAKGYKLKDGRPVLEHFENMGITKPGYPDQREHDSDTWLGHLHEVEKQFTKVDFKRCFDQQQKAYETYRKTGQVRYVTGFVLSGIMSRNKVYNLRIQGPAFHCLLWSLIRLNRWLVKCNMKSKIVCQIHDSIIADVHVDEVDDYLQYAQYLMTEEIRQHWDWIYVPLSVEAEMTPEGGTWNDKQKVEFDL